MSTITRERAELKAFITGFLTDPAHDNQSSRSLTAEVFRIALASLEAEKGAEPVAKVETVGVCWYADNGVPRKPAVGTELFAAPTAPVVTVCELTMWVKRLAHSLRNAKSGSKLPDDAMAYLSAKGLIGVEDALR